MELKTTCEAVRARGVHVSKIWAKRLVISRPLCDFQNREYCKTTLIEITLEVWLIWRINSRSLEVINHFESKDVKRVTSFCFLSVLNREEILGVLWF